MRKRKPATASNILMRAACVLERDGWCRGSHHDDQGRHCALGAIDFAAHDLKATRAQEVAAIVALRAQLSPENSTCLYPGQGVASWNDDLPSYGRRTVVRTLINAAWDAATGIPPKKGK